MKTITVSADALDSIKRMGKADAARIAELERMLSFLQTKVSGIVFHRASEYARVSTDVQTLAKGEN